MHRWEGPGGLAGGNAGFSGQEALGGQRRGLSGHDYKQIFFFLVSPLFYNGKM